MFKLTTAKFREKSRYFSSTYAEARLYYFKLDTIIKETGGQKKYHTTMLFNLAPKKARITVKTLPRVPETA